MYPGNEHRYDAFPVPSRHAILEDAFDADEKHPVRHIVLEVAAVLAPVVAVGIVIAAILISAP